MKPIQRPIRDKVREGARSAFHENMAEAAIGKDGQNVAGGVGSPIGRQCDLFNAGGQRTAPPLLADDEPPCPVLAQNQRIGWQASIRVKHHAGGIGARTAPHIKTRIIGQNRTDPN